MTTVHPPHPEGRLLIRGIRLGLNGTMKALIKAKAERLFRHEPRILRRTPRFKAKGRVELAGPDLTATVTADAAPASITLLIEKLDRMLRKRASNRLRRRTTGDIRVSAAPLMLA
jgi:putative sigma-54 modulation protein